MRANSVQCAASLQKSVWVPAVDLVEAQAKPEVRNLCNFVLNASGVAVQVDGTWCLTLAHGLSDPGAYHPVWGTELVASFLRNQPGYPSVHIAGLLSERDISDGAG